MFVGLLTRLLSGVFKSLIFHEVPVKDKESDFKPRILNALSALKALRITVSNV